MSSNRRHNILSKLLKKSSTSQDKQYFPFSPSPFIILVRFCTLHPSLVSLPPLQLFAFIICLYSVSMHFTLPRARARARVNTDEWGEGEHPIRWPTSVRGLHLRPFRPRGSLLTRTTRKPSTHDFSPLPSWSNCIDNDDLTGHYSALWASRFLGLHWVLSSLYKTIPRIYDRE